MRKSDIDEAYKEVPVNVIDDWVFRMANPCVTAVYHSADLELPEDGDNPMIRALPPFVDVEAIIRSMSVAFAATHAQSYRKWSIERRLLGSDRISRVLVLTPAHMVLLDWLHMALRHRYRGAVPTRTLAARMQANYERTQAGEPVPITHPGHSHSECHSVFALSGSGKTTLVKMVLSTFPMMIEHREFAGIPARFVQVVWMLVSCPPNASVQTLMRGILYWFDLHLGTHYVEEVSGNTGDYIKKVDTELKRHMTGVVVIDEIQFGFKAAEKTQLMGFLTNLLNSNGCVFILVGTPEAKRYLKTLRAGRRVISGGKTELAPYSDDEEWKLLADSIMAIDFLPHAPKAPDAVREALLEVSAGLPAFAKLAWRLTQYLGLRAGEERVTLGLVRAAVREAFAPVAGLLDALRTKDYATLMEYEDMATAAVDAYRAMLEREHQQRSLRVDARHDEFAKKFASSVAMLLDLGTPEPEAESLVRDIMSRNPECSCAGIMREALGSGKKEGARQPSTGAGPARSTRRATRTVADVALRPKRHKTVSANSGDKPGHPRATG